MTFRFPTACLLLTLGLCAALPARAVPLPDMHADLLLQLEADARQALALTPNQATLWQRLVARSKDLLRARHNRREQLQADLKVRLPAAELRELARLADAETQQAALEEKQLRDLWLEMDDALDDRQRGIARRLLLDELDRVADPAMPQHAPREDKPRGEGGRHGGRPGAGTGTPGMGVK
jgi:hypothetical protein